MAASAGSLVVKLGLDAVEFVAGLTKSQYQASQFAKNFSNEIAVGVVKAEVAMRALGDAADFAVRTFPQLIEKTANFQDLAEVTGASAEGLASFGVAAGTAGTTVEAVAQASVKLTKNLTGVDDESKAAGAAIDALGLNLKDFKALAPEEQISALSKSLAGFADGSEKTAVATALLGKSGAELLPFLKALEEQGGRQVIITAEQIAQADEYADKQAKMYAELNAYAQVLAVKALPALTAFTGAIADTAREILGLNGNTTDLRNNNGVADFAETAVRALGFVVDAVDGVVRAFQIVGTSIGASAAAAASVASGEFSAAKTIASEGVKDVQAILDRPLFSDKLNARLAAQKSAAAAATGGNTPLPKLKFNGATKGAGGGGDDPTKRILDNQLKSLENSVKEEEDLLRSRNKMLDLYNGENLLSTQAYFEGKRAAQAAATSSQVALYDQEIAALQKYEASAGKATDRETAQGKINDLLEKKKRLSREAGETAVEWAFKEQKAVDDLARQINSVNAEVLELSGNLGAAARIRIDDQFSDLSKRLGAEGNTAALEQVNRLKALKIAQADYGQQTEQVSQITEALRIQEERIGLARQLGADGELTSLTKLGEARRGALTQMTSLVEAQEAIARASSNPALIQNAERARLELDKLAAVADPLANKFDEIFTGSLGNAFGDFINGTKSAKDAFKDFTSSVMSQIGNLVAQNLAKQLVGSLFGGSTGGGASGFGSLLSSIFGGGRASGGMLSPNTMYRVNENGPEMLDVNGKQYLMNGSRNATVTANHKMGDGGGYTQNIQYVVEGRIDRRTQTQLADETRRKTQAAAVRFA